MTDVIGTAAPDRPARRRRRLPSFVSWFVVSTLVLGFFAVQHERSRLAHEAARWVQEQWAQRTAYDDARASVISAVESSAGVLDAGIVEDAARTADQEEATALRRIAEHMSAHRTWSGAVDAARDAAVVALRSEVRVLAQDAASEHPTAGYLIEPSIDAATQTAVAQLKSMAKRLDVPPTTAPVKVTLAPASADLARLRRPTDLRTGLSIVVDGGAQPEIVNLDTGTVTPLDVPQGNIEVLSWSGHLVLISHHGVEVIRSDGRPGTRFASGFAELLSGSGSSLWVNGIRGVRRFAADGRPMTPWVRLPPHRSVIAATGDVVVLTHVEDEVSVSAEMWNPVTGIRHPLPRACYSGWAAAGRTIVPLPCPGARRITTVDTVSGRVHRLLLPGRDADTAFESFAPLSPSGHELAVIVGQGVPRPGLLDLRTGRFRAVPADSTLAPAGWSSDGQWVLLADAGGLGTGRRPRLALWRPRDGRLTSVRLSPGTSLSAGAQLLTTDG